MTIEECKAILYLLEQIQQEAYNKYMNVYMQEFNEQAGNIPPLVKPIPFKQRIPNAALVENVIDEAIQETNIRFVYQLNHAITFRAKLPQNKRSQISINQMIADGLDYMADMTYEMHGRVAPTLPDNASVQQICTLLQSILDILKNL